MTVPRGTPWWRRSVIKRMKPLGFAVEEMRELLTLLADLAASTAPRDQLLALLTPHRERSASQAAWVRAGSTSSSSECAPAVATHCRAYSRVGPIQSAW